VFVALILHLFYNIFVHPLRNAAGPKLWAACRLPWCWYQHRGVLQYKLLELHVKYGHAVRVAPNEMSFTSENAWKTIYGQRSVEMPKDPIFSLLTPTGVQSQSACRRIRLPLRTDNPADIMVADRETHTRQRRLLSHAFSEKALREQESLLQLHVSKFLEQLSNNSAAGPVNMVAWANLLSPLQLHLSGVFVLTINSL